MKSPKRSYFLLLINFIFHIAFFYFIPQMWGTPDDAAMMLISSGAYTGTPSPQLIYTHIFIGEILSFLYLWKPHINFYDFYIASVLLISSSLVVRRLGQLLNGTHLVLFTLLFYTLYALVLLKITFTATALLAGLCGILFIFKGAKRDFLIGLIFLTLCFFIREYCLYLILILTLPLFALRFLQTNQKKAFILAGVISILLLTALKLSIDLRNTSSDWSSYHTYNLERGKLHGSPKLTWKDNESTFEKINWSYLDFKLFKSWFFFTNNLYGLDQLTFLNKNLKPPTNRSLKENMNRIYDQTILKMWKELALTFLFIILVMILVHGPQRRLLAAYYGYGLSLFFFIGFMIRMPERLGIPFLICLHFAPILSTGSLRLNKFKMRSFASLIAIALLFILAKEAQFIRSESKIIGQGHKNMSEALAILSREYQDAFLVAWSPQFPIHYLQPFSNHYLLYKKINIMRTGWALYSPLNKEIMDKHSIVEIPLDLVDNDNAFIVMTEYQSRLLKEHMQEKLAMTVEAVKTIDLEQEVADGFSSAIYKLVKTAR